MVTVCIQSNFISAVELSVISLLLILERASVKEYTCLPKWILI